MTAIRKRPSPVAASERAKAILRRISSELGIQQIDLLDQFAIAGEQYYEHHGKRLLLPLRFTEAFRVISLVPSSATVLEEPPRQPGRSGKPRLARG